MSWEPWELQMRDEWAALMERLYPPGEKNADRMTEEFFGAIQDVGEKMWKMAETKSTPSISPVVLAEYLRGLASKLENFPAMIEESQEVFRKRREAAGVPS